MQNKREKARYRILLYSLNKIITNTFIQLTEISWFKGEARTKEENQLQANFI